MKKKFLYLLLVLVLVLCACSEPPAQTQDVQPQNTKHEEITILYTGDVHTALSDNIGYAGLAHYKNSLIQDGKNVLTVDVGDFISASPVNMKNEGSDIVEIMNMVGYDIVTIGNHELDYGPAALEKNLESAHFSVTSLNYIKGGQNVFPRYVLVQTGGTMIAFVGVTTPLTQTVADNDLMKDADGNVIYDFMADGTGELLWDSTQDAIDDAKDEGAAYVVILSHLGINEGEQPYTSYELIENITGVDVVLDGHSHSVIENEFVVDKNNNDVLLTATGTAFENIGILTLNNDGTFESTLVDEYSEKDSEISELIDGLFAEVDGYMGETVATIYSDMIAKGEEGDWLVRAQETNLGNLTADAYRFSTQSDIAIANAGNIRENLTSGKISLQDVLTTFPYSNTVVKINITGSEILDMLEFSARDLSGENGGFLQVSGLTFTINTSIESSVSTDENGGFVSVDAEYRVNNVFINGEPLNSEKIYTLAGVEYILQNGGDGYSMLSDNEILTFSINYEHDVFIDYLVNEYQEKTELYKEPNGEGRITIN